MAMSKHKYNVRGAALVLSLLIVGASSAQGETSATGRASHLFVLALHSANGPKLKLAAISEVLYRLGKGEKVNLVTKHGLLLSFYIRNSKAFMLGQAKLKPSNSHSGFPPTGPLGDYFERRGQRISNTITGPKNTNLGFFIGDLDDPDPIMAYKVLPDGALLFEKTILAHSYGE